MPTSARAAAECGPSWTLNCFQRRGSLRLILPAMVRAYLCGRLCVDQTATFALPCLLVPTVDLIRLTQSLNFTDHRRAT
jgi:hypothetical protein